MNNKTNKLLNAFFIAFFCLLNTICYGQTIIAGTNKKTDLPSFYNETKLCDAVKKIGTELGKSNKSNIIGKKIKKTIDEEEMVFYKQKYTSLITIDNFEGSVTINKYNNLTYYEYSGYLTADPFENGTYQKEFELISSQLETCMNKEPKKDNVFGSLSNFFLIGNDYNVQVNLNRNKSRMWIVIKGFSSEN